MLKFYFMVIKSPRKNDSTLVGEKVFFFLIFKIMVHSKCALHPSILGLATAGQQLLDIIELVRGGDLDGILS